MGGAPCRPSFGLEPIEGDVKIFIHVLVPISVLVKAFVEFEILYFITVF